MSTKDLVNAIVLGDAIEIENAFQATMAEKISARLDDMRVDVAQNMFKVQESVELDEEPDWKIRQREKDQQRDDHNRKVAQQFRDRLGRNSERDNIARNISNVAKSAHPNAVAQAGQSSSAFQPAKTGKTKNFQGKPEGVQLSKEEVEQILASEEFAQLDELSKTTLGNYIKKASGGVKGAMSHAYVAGGGTGASEEGKKKSFDTAQKRLKGIRTAVDKLTKEDVEQLVVTTVESALYAMQDGRNVLDEQMDEAVSSSSKDNYEWTHGNKPKGHGNWYFSTVHPRQHNFDQHKDQTVNVTGTFGDAAKKAQAHFKEKGHKGEIHVLT